MKLRSVIIFSLLFCSISGVTAQTIKKETEVLQTKMDRFTSKTGAFSKFIDNKLPSFKTSYSSAETRIRKLIVGPEAVYFYQIEKSGQYSNTTASIEYADLLEVTKALHVLQTDVDKDIATNPDYLENKFTTVDGFQVGYFISKGAATWYIKLEKYGSDNTVFLNDFSVLDASFNGAKAKIEELKKL